MIHKTGYAVSSTISFIPYYSITNLHQNHILGAYILHYVVKLMSPGVSSELRVLVLIPEAFLERDSHLCYKSMLYPLE